MTEAVQNFIQQAREANPEIVWEYYSNACVVSVIMPLQANEGMYVGRCYYDVVDKKVAVLDIAAGPFSTSEAAKEHISKKQ